MKDVFISYKSEEFGEASWVKSTLETNGISCWMAPACIPGGSSYAVEIPKAIKQCKIFVLILSSRAQASQWVSKEVDLAINEGKIVLPFMLENCKLQDDFNFYLTNVQRYTAYENKVAAAEKMLREIKGVLGSGSGGTAAPSGAAYTPPSPPPPPREKPKSTYTYTYTTPTMPKKKDPPKPKKKAELFCVLSSLSGICSIVFTPTMPLPFSILTLIFGFLGIRNARKKDLGGRGFAITGLVIGLLGMMAVLIEFLGAPGLLILVALVVFTVRELRKK